MCQSDRPEDQATAAPIDPAAEDTGQWPLPQVQDGYDAARSDLSEPAMVAPETEHVEQIGCGVSEASGMRPSLFAEEQRLTGNVKASLVDPKPESQIEAAAEAAEIPERTLITAADHLGVRCRRRLAGAVNRAVSRRRGSLGAARR